MRRICGFRCNAYVLVVQLLRAMQCHITESAFVCVCRWQLSGALGCSAPGQSCSSQTWWRPHDLHGCPFWSYLFA
ncbi:hypothetical protein BDFB_012697 [Asbolus verrucosus]|uniref:Secreted protein n=1 Tax=Asbolus verrucosus TaxID=1661398 RepID=A0A482VR47_ASBVE|nr:hypothetical protein BDFB_012697 [Asbolus verrucosus]